MTASLLPGLKVGHFTDTRRPTGCTVVLCEAGAICDRVLHRSHNLKLSGPSRRKNPKTND